MATYMQLMYNLMNIVYHYYYYYYYYYYHYYYHHHYSIATRIPPSPIWMIAGLEDCRFGGLLLIAMIEE